MKKFLLTLIMLLVLTVSAHAFTTLFSGNAQANRPVYVLQKIFTFAQPITITTSIPCNVVLTPTYLLGIGQNPNFPVVTYTNVTSFTVNKGPVYMLELTPLSSGQLTVIEE